ncbi:unnamed protein product [Camellia sinensis]
MLRRHRYLHRQDQGLMLSVTQGSTVAQPLPVANPFGTLPAMPQMSIVYNLHSDWVPSKWVLVLFLCTVPPTMYLFSTIEGAISRSSRKKSACCKVLYLLIWNVFFVNVVSGKVIERLSVVSSPKDVTAQLATSVPTE